MPGMTEVVNVGVPLNDDAGILRGTVYYLICRWYTYKSTKCNSY